MYRHYLETFSRALRELNARLGSHWTAPDFYVHVPAYVSAPSPLGRDTLYAVHQARALGCEAADFARGVGRVLKRKFC